tara:strand:- start:6272 stop:7732 length:1461 start_codon:yes stop_codon:yes gene_type:complete
LKQKIKIAWVCRDGYLDLFPLIEKELGSAIDLDSHIITHLEKDKIYLEENYNFQNVEVLSNSINNILKEEFSPNQLEELSKKYNKVPMNRLLWSTVFEEDLKEREIFDLAIAHILFWERFIERTSVNYLVYERPSVLSSCIAWLVSQHKGVRSIDYVDTALDTMTIVDNFNGDYAERLINRYQEIRKNDSDNKDDDYFKAEQYLSNINTAPKKTNESILAGEMTNRRASLGFQRIINLINLYKNQPKEKEYYIYDSSLYEKILGNLLYIFRAFFHKIVNIFYKAPSQQADKYFLYPLFMKGEFSNHIFMNPGYQDPIAEVKRIATCLPPQHFLYVKEHYSGYPDRKIIDLLKIRNIKNVKLISPKEDPFSLVNASKGVITSGSTMGFEAMMKSKPVFLTGDPWYRYLPGIKRVSRVEDVSQALSSVDNFILPSTSEKLSVLKALYSISSKGLKMPREGALETENVENMANIISKYIKNTHELDEAK